MINIRITNKSNLNSEDFLPLFQSFLPYAQKEMGLDRDCEIVLLSDPDNGQLPLGKTGYYSPSEGKIAVYTDGRHIKDIMRSISHELVHHTQNCRGEFDNDMVTSANYAQDDSHLRSMEEEAYSIGNLCFRDWEDLNKSFLQESRFYNIGIKQMIKESKDLLLEGGAAGHMSHPFDVDYVKSGKDLKDFFITRVPAYLENNIPSIKTDGINVSFKLISRVDAEGNEVREFAVDRGSKKAIDIEGITLDRIGERFETGHGMIPALTDLLTILNTALNAGTIDSELKALGLWDNKDYFLNAEYVKEVDGEAVNVIEYGEDFIAIHGVSEFFVKPSPTGVSFSRKSREVKVNDNSSTALAQLISKVRNYSDKYSIFGPDDVHATKVKEIDWNPALSEKLEIFTVGYESISKSIGEWLSSSNMNNPIDEVVNLRDPSEKSGQKQAGALSKKVYIGLAVDKVPVTELLADDSSESEFSAAIAGAVWYHATRVLGVAVLESLTTTFGSDNVANHEGIVMRSSEVFDVTYPIKITGDFIYTGVGGTISKKRDKEEKNAEIKRKIAVFPGKFKPPHRGHMNLVEDLIKKGADHVYVLISPLNMKTPEGRPVDHSVSKRIWEVYINAKGLAGKVTVGKSPYNSPVKASFDILAGQVPAYVPVAGDLVIPAASDKIDSRSGKPDYIRFENFHKGLKTGMIDGVIPANIMEWYFKAPAEAPLSATDFRAALDTGKGLEAFLPTGKGTEGIAQKVLNILGVKPEVEEVEGEELEETSVAANVGGYSAPLGSEKSIIREDDPMIDEVLNYLLRKLESK